MNTEPRRPQSGSRPDDPGEFGRIVSEGFMFHIWHCRWCGLKLRQEGAAVICTACDRSAVVWPTGDEPDEA